MQNGMPICMLSKFTIEIHAAMATKHSELLTDDVYSRLRDMIVSSILQPGQKLVDRDLAARLGVSRTPVREALGRLAMIGLVEARTRRGYYVTQFSTKQVADLYEFREMLEVQAVKLAIRNAQPSHLLEFDSMLGDLEKLTPNPIDHASAVKLDLRIHELIARASGNHSLHQAMLNVLDKVMCFISVEIADKDALAAAHRQHQAILSKIKEKDAEAAAELISSHVESALESLIEVFRARDEIRNAVLAATPLKKGESDQRAADIETQLGGTS
jgi:DNA-binding GntR family transcriptional regulator